MVWNHSSSNEQPSPTLSSSQWWMEPRKTKKPCMSCAAFVLIATFIRSAQLSPLPNGQDGGRASSLNAGLQAASSHTDPSHTLRSFLMQRLRRDGDLAFLYLRKH